MNKKRWLTLGGMLLALFLFLGVSPPGRASASVAYDFSSLTDDNVAKLREWASGVQAGSWTDNGDKIADMSTYIVYRSTFATSDNPALSMITTCDIAYFYTDNTEADSPVYAHVECPKSSHGHHYCGWTFSPKDGNYLRTGIYIKESDTYWKRDSYSCSYSSGISSFNFKIPGLRWDSLSVQMYAANVSIKDKTGAVFFARAPLAANWLKIADQTIQEKLVEVRQNHPRLPELGQIRLGLIAVVCCLVSLIALNKLLRVLKNSAVR